MSADRSSRAWLAIAGFAVVAAAVSGPLDNRADASLTVHMVQHLLLITVAPPLLVLGRPIDLVRRILPPAWRSRYVAATRWLTVAGRDARWMAWAGAALSLQTVVMFVWHVPLLFDAALRHPVLHAAEHLSFLGSAVAFWWAIIGAGRRARYGVAVLAVFLACLPATLLGAGFALAHHPWYAGYDLADQQMAGVFMWSLGGLAYLVAAAGLFQSWVRGMEHATPSRVGLS